MVENIIHNTGLSKNWFALYTKPRHEFKASENLHLVEVEHYLPTVTRLKQWSDRKKKIIEPLIRGYIFVFVTEKERFLALQQNGIVRCVSFHGQPAIIPEWQIENLKKMLNRDSDFTLSEVIKVGAKVKVIDGPFQGVIGVVNYTQSGKTISITIDMLKRSVTAVLPAESVVKALEE
ncbi:MAG: UpxY family transcription antiterminator [Ignavibacteriales bacterium]|nr:UpxY family transcription antiterminator [Ignavibacteriales bacterium]